MPVDIGEKWDNRYKSSDHGQSKPAQLLYEFQHLFPKTGKALDLACGIGLNAIFLAEHGLETYAWDISSQAISRLDTIAQQKNLLIKTEIRDVCKHPPQAKSFDIIYVGNFLDRGLFPEIVNALGHNGILFYQTFIQEKTENDTGPRNKDYLLGPNELLKLCSGLHIIYYHEEGRVGNIKTGFRNRAALIGQRRKI